LQLQASRRNVVPSLATSLWLIVVAAAQTDPLSPPSHGRDAGVPIAAKPAVTAPKAPPSVAKPMEPNAAKAAKAPSAPAVATPTIPVPQPGKAAKAPTGAVAAPTELVEPEEEIVADASGRLKGSKKGPRRVTTSERPDRLDRAEAPERKNPWSGDRYAAVVPPGLTLAALRSQISKVPTVAVEPGAPASDLARPTSAVSDIEKARESLRQETARLEALLKSAGSCGGGSGMSMGDPLLPTTPISAATLREAASEQIDTVSKAMKGMKPEQAGALVARLDRGLAAEILRRMKSTDAGAILGLLKPDLAADLATEIAIRKPMYGKDKKASPK
jgi:flagellar motility protein MotE (MotC chaperone)